MTSNQQQNTEFSVKSNLPLTSSSAVVSAFSCDVSIETQTYLIFSSGVSALRYGSQNPAEPSAVVSGENCSEIMVTCTRYPGNASCEMLTAVESPLIPAPTTHTLTSMLPVSQVSTKLQTSADLYQTTDLM